MTTVVLPQMPPAQTASWIGLFDLADRMPDGWTLVGGQMVQLHCFERDLAPIRSKSDVDAVLDVREHPDALMSVTRVLSEVGFVTALAMSVNGTNHRWRRPGIVGRRRLISECPRPGPRRNARCCGPCAFPPHSTRAIRSR